MQIQQAEKADIYEKSSVILKESTTQISFV